MGTWENRSERHSWNYNRCHCSKTFALLCQINRLVSSRISQNKIMSRRKKKDVSWFFILPSITCTLIERSWCHTYTLIMSTEWRNLAYLYLFIIVFWSKPLWKKYFTLLQKTLFYYRKMYFTKENLTTWKVFFLQNLSRLKFNLAFENWLSFYFDIN